LNFKIDLSMPYEGCTPQQQCSMICQGAMVISFPHGTTTNFFFLFIDSFSSIWNRDYKVLIRLLFYLTGIVRVAFVAKYLGSIDSANPVASPIFDRLSRGPPGGCLNTGDFANWQVTNPNLHCLTRAWSETSGNTFTAGAVLRQIISGARSFRELSQDMEVAHNQVHSSIGGDMSGSFSPNDPIFVIFVKANCLVLAPCVC
jgi:hypothetical protein